MGGPSPASPPAGRCWSRSAVAALAGLVSFLSPCVLPLVPGYLSYVTGLAGADLDDALQRPDAAARGRILLGTAGFVAGFTVGVHARPRCSWPAARHGAAGEQADRSSIVAGAADHRARAGFLGLVPGLQREWRMHSLPAAGLASAPVLGAVFALGWAPCIGPTFGAVLGAGHGQRLDRPGGHPDRGVLPGPRACRSSPSGWASASSSGCSGRCGATASGSPGSAARC